MRGRAHLIHDAVRSQLWPIPILGVLVAVILGAMVPQVAALVDGRLSGWLDDLMFSGDAGAARSVLDAVSSSLITVTSLTFSLTVVTLQLASSQFSPRLLRTFTKDLFVQVTLAVFLATFTFSLTVLRAVRSSEESAAPFVPRIAVSASFLLAITSVVCLVLFLAHLTRQIRIETMLENVHTEATETAQSTLTRHDEPVPSEPLPLRPVGHLRVHAECSGFLLRTAENDIIDIACEIDGIVAVERMPGDFVVAGTLIGTVWRRDGSPLTASEAERAATVISSALHVGPERTGAQDVRYGLRQLVDVVNKALSPGINDPTTAVHALGHISAFLCELAPYRLGPVVRADQHDVVRVEFTRPTFADCLDLALTQPRHYGGSDPLLVIRLLELLQELAWSAPIDDLPTVLDQLDRLTATARKQDFDRVEQTRHARLVEETRNIAANRQSR